jgi:hypothetical protein
VCANLLIDGGRIAALLDSSAPPPASSMNLTGTLFRAQ